MAQLSANTVRQYEVLSEFNSVPVKQSSAIYKGSAVGLTGGYARQLNAGDDFAGFAEEYVSAASATADGAVNLVVRSTGVIYADISALAVTDIGKPVYMSDGNVFTLTAGSNTHIGKVFRWVATGYGMVAFNAQSAGSLDTITALTDNSGGATADGTIAAVTAPTALTDNGGGTADNTVAAMTAVTALTVSDGAGTNDGTIGNITADASVIAAVQEIAAKIATVATFQAAVKDNFKELTTAQAANRAAIIALTDAVKELATKVNEIIASSR